MWHEIEIKGPPSHIVVKTKIGLGLASTNPCPQGAPFGPLPPYNNFFKFLPFSLCIDRQGFSKVKNGNKSLEINTPRSEVEKIKTFCNCVELVNINDQ